MNVDSNINSFSASDIYDTLSSNSDMVEETSESDDATSSVASDNINYTDYLSNIETNLEQLISLQSVSDDEQINFNHAVITLLLVLVLVTVLRGFVSRIRGL